MDHARNILLDELIVGAIGASLPPRDDYARRVAWANRTLQRLEREHSAEAILTLIRLAPKPVAALRSVARDFVASLPAKHR